MALTPTEKVTASEAARETLAKVEAAASDLTAEQETAIAAELVKYEELKDKIKLEVKGEVNLSFRTLLEEIRQRIRKHFGWPALSPEVFGAPAVGAFVGGISRAGKAAVEADSDRVRPAFRRDLFG
jgi:hypothetical protein